MAVQVPLSPHDSKESAVNARKWICSIFSAYHAEKVPDEQSFAFREAEGGRNSCIEEE